MFSKRCGLNHVQRTAPHYSFPQPALPQAWHSSRRPTLVRAEGQPDDGMEEEESIAGFRRMSGKSASTSETVALSPSDYVRLTSDARFKQVFTQQRWNYHRSTSRYFRHLKGVLKSSTFKSLAQPLAFLTFNALVVCVYEALLEAGRFPAGFPQISVGDTPFELTSFALALLLVFRTDTSYGRWNEALETWSNVRNSSNEFVRDAVCWVKDVTLQALIIRWTTAFSRSLLVYLRQQGDIRDELSGLLLPHEINAVAQHSDSLYPQYVLQVLTEIIARAKLTEIREDKLLASLKNFNDAIGVGEKILRYPIPLTYTRHTSRFMIVWLSFLPLAIWDDCGWATVPIMPCISFFLLGVEEIGVQIEEPFSMLPLNDMCKDIRSDLAGVLTKMSDIATMIDYEQSAAGITNSAEVRALTDNWMWEASAMTELESEVARELFVEDLPYEAELEAVSAAYIQMISSEAGRNRSSRGSSSSSGSDSGYNGGSSSSSGGGSTGNSGQTWAGRIAAFGFNVIGAGSSTDNSSSSNRSSSSSSNVDRGGSSQAPAEGGWGYGSAFQPVASTGLSMRERNQAAVAAAVGRNSLSATGSGRSAVSSRLSRYLGNGGDGGYQSMFEGDFDKTPAQNSVERWRTALTGGAVAAPQRRQAANVAPLLPIPLGWLGSRPQAVQGGMQEQGPAPIADVTVSGTSNGRLSGSENNGSELLDQARRSIWDSDDEGTLLPGSSANGTHRSVSSVMDENVLSDVEHN